jgi:hypothetical protein
VLTKSRRIKILEYHIEQQRKFNSSLYWLNLFLLEEYLEGKEKELMILKSKKEIDKHKELLDTIEEIKKLEMEARYSYMLLFN